MTRALLKKQMGELLSFLTQSGKRGKRRSKGMLLLYGLLFLYVGAAVVFQFAFLMSRLCGPLGNAGLGWLYFAIAGMVATAVAVVLGMFLVQSQLFEARDNEFLLSMPIPVPKILLCRLAPLYVQNFLVEALVLIPAAAVYGAEFGFSVLSAALFGGLLFFTPLLGLALTCILGWLTALVSSRTRWKSLVTVLLSLTFLAAYFTLYLRLNEYLGLILQNSRVIGDKVRIAFYPFTLLGRAAEGNAGAFFLFVLLALGLFAAVCLALAKSFRRIAAGGRGGRAKYREKPVKLRSTGRALLRKEGRRFWKTPVYLLNCGLGTVFLLVLGAAAVIKKEEALMLLGQVPLPRELLPLSACGAVSLMASTNLASAPSISLEGDTLWLLRSLPVSGWQILWGKLRFHLRVTAPAALLCGLAMDWVLAPTPVAAVLLPVIPALFVLLSGELGLLYTLRFPYLDWSTETAAVKQSPAVALALCSGWGLIAAFAGLYFLTGRIMSPEMFLLLAGVLLAAACLALLRLLKTWGVKRFSEL